MKHTPGPWMFESSDEGLWVYADPNEPVICDLVARLSSYDESTKMYTSQFQSEDEVNAKLIAAAPDLLEALQYCLSVWEKLGPNAEPWLVPARAAIKKATV